MWGGIGRERWHCGAVLVEGGVAGSLVAVVRACVRAVIGESVTYMPSPPTHWSASVRVWSAALCTARAFSCWARRWVSWLSALHAASSSWRSR